MKIMDIKKAALCGSFDPYTIGHHALVLRALEIFDVVYIGIGMNKDKQPFFPIDKKIEIIKNAFDGTGLLDHRVIIKPYEGLTVNFCVDNRISYLVRGIRNTIDFEYEKTMEQVNNDLAPDIKTVYFTVTNLSMVSSSMVRELMKNQRDVSKYTVNFVI